ncbi:MAG: Ig-like domain-containing protein, partial [Bacillota bacterium]|nr:Ig-like domain-containing protein [Bacillota bacterium]
MLKLISKIKPVYYTATAIFLALLAIFLFYLKNQPSDKNAGFITGISALKNTGHGIDADTDFVITCSSGMGEKELEKSLVVTPSSDYTLKKQGKDKYLLKFSKELAADSIISFSDDGSGKRRSWAFQTENVFKVVSVLPSDRINNVPVNTGIEVTLSYLDVANFEESFSIEPKVSGKFEKHGKTYVFAPDSLKTDTLYTVKIDKGLASSGGEKLKQDYVFSFRTQKETPADGRYIYVSGDIAETFASGIAPVIEVYSSGDFKNTDFNVKLFKFGGASGYLKALKDRYSYINDNLGYSEDYSISTEGLSQISEFTSKISRSDLNQTWLPGFIAFPDNLPDGQYLADITGGGAHLQKLIQVHPYSVYSMSVNGSELVWVNSTKTGAPVSGVNADINGTKAETASDGTARIDTPEIKSEDFAALTVSGSEVPFIAALNLSSSDSSNKINEQYYTYIYTDRAKYQPTDTVSVWGAVIPRDGKFEIPGSAELRLDIGSYDSTPLKTEVQVDKSGTFSGKLKIDGLASGQY